MIKSTNDSTGHWSASVKSQNLPPAASTGCNMISDFRAIRLRILRGVKAERKRLKFSKQSKAGQGKKNLDKKNHQNQTTSSNSSGTVLGVIYGGDEMALFERCHVWAL